MEREYEGEFESEDSCLFRVGECNECGMCSKIAEEEEGNIITIVEETKYISEEEYERRFKEALL